MEKEQEASREENRHGKTQGARAQMPEELPEKDSPSGPWPRADREEMGGSRESGGSRSHQGLTSQDLPAQGTAARADLDRDQLAWLDRLNDLFPRGFLFCTPAKEDSSQLPWEQKNHILFSYRNLDRMWGALYGQFEPCIRHPLEEEDLDRPG